MLAKWRLASVLVVLSCIWLCPRPAMAQEADSEFRDGVAAFEEGRFEDAERHFSNVIKSRPDHEQALRYRDEAGYHFWIRVLARGGRLGTVARRILKAAEEEAIRERQDESKLREDMKGLWDDDLMVQYETTERLVAVYGHYVVPELVDVLRDRRDDEKRVRALQLLARLGDEGTLALVELLEADDPTLQMNAAYALGHTHDVRAVPPLQRLAQRTEDEHVREAAQKAIAEIGGPSFSTAEYFARIAEEFYRGNPLLLINRYNEYVVWKWQNDRLTKTTVPRFRWNEEVAEEYCYDGLSVAPDDDKLWTLLLSVYAQEWTEIEDSLRVAQSIQDRGGTLDDDEVSTMKAMQGRLAKLKGLVASRGPDGLLSALGKALADRKAQVAVFMIERLQELKFDAALLSGGGQVQFLQPVRNQPQPTAPTPAPRPSPTPQASPQPMASPEPTPAASPTPEPVEEPEPTPVEPNDDNGEPQGPGMDDNPFGDEPEPNASPSESPEPEPSTPRRRPRRVSQAAPQVQNQVERFGYRGPMVLNNADALGAMGTTGNYTNGGAAFSEALVYGDKRVRYAAAIAAAHLNPAGTYGNADKVMTNLIDALGESGQRVVLVVERDQHNRNRIVGLLRELGYMAFGIESGRLGLVRARTFPSEDLIIVSSELNPDNTGDEPMAIQFIDALKDDYRTKPIKTMILAPADKVDENMSLVDEGRTLDVFEPEIDRATLADKLNKAFASPEDERDEKSRSNMIAQKAAEAIATLRPTHTIYDIASASGPLAENVKRSSGRPAPVRLACLAAISAIGPGARAACLDVLASEFRDKTNSTEIRTALGMAIGDCVKGQEISGDVFQVLKAALQEDDTSIWDACFYALGKAKLTGQQAREVFEQERLGE